MTGGCAYLPGEEIIYIVSTVCANRFRPLQWDTVVLLYKTLLTV